MKITPVKGTNDYLPAQAELRDYLQRKICETYENCGFQRIFTPILEDIENLDKSEEGRQAEKSDGGRTGITARRYGPSL